MNILIVTRYNNDGGVVTHVINLANELIKKGNTVVVAAPYDSTGLKGRYIKLRCEFMQIDFESKNFVGIIRQLDNVIKEHNIQLIHSHNRNTSIYAQYFKLTKGIPFVWTLHQNNIPIKFPYKVLTFPGDKTIVVSNALKNFCINKLDISTRKVSVIYNGVYENNYIVVPDVDRIKEKFKIKPNEIVVVLLSRLERRKGHMMLLKALMLVNTKKNIRVLITGNDLDNGEYRSELELFIKRNHIEGNISFVGYVDPVEILSISDAMVLPSEKEGQSISMIESFLMKVPVIRTKTGGYEENKGICIGIDDEKQLAMAIEKILDGSNLDQMVEDAYNFARKNYTIDVMIEQVQNVYKELIKE